MLAKFGRHKRWVQNWKNKNWKMKIFDIKVWQVGVGVEWQLYAIHYVNITKLFQKLNCIVPNLWEFDLNEVHPTSKNEDEGNPLLGFHWKYENNFFVKIINLLSFKCGLSQMIKHTQHSLYIRNNRHIIK